MAHLAEKRNSYRDLMVQSEGKRPLGRHRCKCANRPCGRLRHRWENIVEIDVKEIRWKGMDWINRFGIGQMSGCFEQVINWWIV
jgi:hypothetical protein